MFLPVNGNIAKTKRKLSTFQHL